MIYGNSASAQHHKYFQKVNSGKFMEDAWMDSGYKVYGTFKATKLYHWSNDDQRLQVIFKHK